MHASNNNMGMLAEQYYANKFCMHLRKNIEETILLLQEVFRKGFTVVGD